MDVLSGGRPRNLIQDENETVIGPMAAAAGPVLFQAGSGFSIRKGWSSALCAGLTSCSSLLGGNPQRGIPRAL